MHPGTLPKHFLNSNHLPSKNFQVISLGELIFKILDLNVLQGRGNPKTNKKNRHLEFKP